MPSMQPSTQGTDARSLARQVVDYLRALLLLQMDNSAQTDLAGDVRGEAEKHAKQFMPGELLRLIRLFNAAANDPRGGWQPALPLEMAFGESLEGTKQEIKMPEPIEAKRSITPEVKKEETKRLSWGTCIPDRQQAIQHHK